MGGIDVYLRSIERFGAAAGALLASGQSVTLKFPTGDRHATQVQPPHDQLVALGTRGCPARGARSDRSSQAGEVRDRQQRHPLHDHRLHRAPTSGRWASSRRHRAARTVRRHHGRRRAPGAHGGQAADRDYSVAGKRPSGSHPQQPNRDRQSRSIPTPNVGQSSPSSVVEAVPGPDDDDDDMSIERGQYDGTLVPQTSSGSRLLDWLTSQARAVNASDVYLTAGAPAFMRVGGELAATNDRGPLEAEILSRELGIVARRRRPYAVARARHRCVRVWRWRRPGARDVDARPPRPWGGATLARRRGADARATVARGGRPPGWTTTA